MEQGLHHAATGGAQEMGSDQFGGPGEITATTGHDHQLATAREEQRAEKGTIRRHQCGGLGERKHERKMSAGGFLFKGSGNSGGHPLITPLLYQYWRTMRQVGRVFGALFLNLYGSRSRHLGHQQQGNSSES
jgi:hypothetical protein